MGNQREQIQTSGNEPEIACGRKEFWTPPFPFPPPGESRGGRVPPTPGARCAASQKTLARIVRRLPPQEGCRPLVHPLRSALVHVHALQRFRSLKRRIDFGRVVYTEYLTLPFAQALKLSK